MNISLIIVPLLAMTGLERDVEFILQNAPPQDMPLAGAFVTNNCVLAAEARASAIEEYPDEIYLDYVLPYSVIREERDDWREEFRERFRPIIAGCKTSYEAAVKLDRTIWDEINVHYDTRRDKARQSPRHSMRIGMASCTGISIILIDACRALGIPARLVGCNWTTIPGNHSWVEVWSEGRWRVLASGEKEREDSIWFLDYAAMADPSRPETRIYASRTSPSPEGTRFWLTWDHPQSVSDVPADDVTERYAIKPRMAIIASPSTLADAVWADVPKRLAAKHAGDAQCSVHFVAPTNAASILRETKPRYVAFVMRPEDFDRSTLLELKTMMRELDDDPFDDAIWGIITGPDAATAQRIASSTEPHEITTTLATTGVPEDLVAGQIGCISDAFPKGVWWRKDAGGSVEKFCNTNDLASIFAELWRDIDPEFVLTSSHATERNLEMPFSIGNIISSNGVFVATDKVASPDKFIPLARPECDKVWLAAGNCLIANHIASDDMVMTALSFGKVNQFAGYIKETWFGFVGWNTWRYLRTMGYSLSQAYYAANALLNVKLSEGAFADDLERQGLEWDRDATVFYGDPMQHVRLGGGHAAPEDGTPYFVIFPDSTRSHKVSNAPPGSRIFNADDFAIVWR